MIYAVADEKLKPVLIIGDGCVIPTFQIFRDIFLSIGLFNRKKWSYTSDAADAWGS